MEAAKVLTKARPVKAMVEHIFRDREKLRGSSGSSGEAQSVAMWKGVLVRSSVMDGVVFSAIVRGRPYATSHRCWRGG